MNIQGMTSLKEYVCDPCAYRTQRKCDYAEHLATSKHAVKAKNAVRFHCLNCPYETNTSSHFKRHIERHHNKLFKCDLCTKQFDTIEEYNPHHAECCLQHQVKRLDDILGEKMEAQKAIFDEQKAILDEQMEAQKKALLQSIALPDTETLVKLITQAAKELAPSITHTNSHNNTTFNVQVFLNEQCKDAMNIEDFARTLKIDLNDVEHLGRVGYVKGITDVVTRGLNSLGLYQRPIHCTDIKRETVHVKHEDRWQKEEPGLPILLAAVKYVAFVNMKKVSDQWLLNHAENRRNSSDAMMLMYESIIRERLGGTGTDAVYHRKNDQIMKNICRAAKLNRSLSLKTARE
jgi:hypothetical protein